MHKWICQQTMHLAVIAFIEPQVLEQILHDWVEDAVDHLLVAHSLPRVAVEPGDAGEHLKRIARVPAVHLGGIVALLAHPGAPAVLVGALALVDALQNGFRLLLVRDARSLEEAKRGNKSVEDVCLCVHRRKYLWLHIHARHMHSCRVLYA